MCAYLLPYECVSTVDYFANFGKVGLGCALRWAILNGFRRNLRYNLVLKVRPVVAFSQQYDNVVSVLTSGTRCKAVAAIKETA